jgi:adenylate cyclase
MPSFVFADLAGFAALTEAHGDAGAADLVRDFETLVRRILPPHARLVKMVGDAAMIVTDDPCEAICLARGLMETAESLPGRPALRIGVHAGEAIERDGDYLGHAVNIAARVAGEARPCEILVTDDALRGIGDRIRAVLAPEPLGESRLRNLSQPVALYRITAGSGALATDPVCRMRLRPGEAVATLKHNGKTYAFCAPQCARTFAEHPEAHTEP